MYRCINLCSSFKMLAAITRYMFHSLTYQVLNQFLGQILLNLQEMYIKVNKC
jgi:hypothetical protein